MLPKKFLAAAVMAAVFTAPATQSSADVHGLIGAVIIGGAIANANKNKKRTTKRVYSGSSSATRTKNRETQTALNYFGFNAGGADGVLGRKSRTAISGMQNYLQLPVTGRLTQFERDILIGAYQRGIGGAYETVQLVSKSPDGSRILLQEQKKLMTGVPTQRSAGYAGLPLEVSQAVDEIANSSDPTPEQLLQRSGFIQLADLNGDGNNDFILDTSFSGSTFWCSSVQCKTLVFVSTPNGYARNDLLAFNPTPATFNCVGSSCVVSEQVVTASIASSSSDLPSSTEVALSSDAPASGLPSFGSTPDTGSGGALPLFGAPATASAPLSSTCTKISMVANANGGLTTVAFLDDPNKVMMEQLCLTRALVMDQGEQLALAIPGVTLAQVDAQCGQYGDALKDHVTALSLKPRSEVIEGVGGFVLNSGMDPAQLANTARICMASGYRLDDMNVALGTGMLLVILGEPPYGEMMGHHLSQGVGTSARVDLALQWYQEALTALDAGAQPVFAPNQIERPALVRAAADMLAGGTNTGFVTPAQSGGAKAKLPTFGAPKN
ncbi:putative peptidoglycan-binding domain-containing protein [Candidatus Rhodobacter oscarellae]|uniref:Putative peptidoglycan-binding domain-containing protein n=1 Tax=Candidatus Rhodobacter oscarellae TaxID=1675527 RepID=A0A0J9GUA7_9RHOB|nr:peptidoglycan-binding domain-containing protein [Candidatus Rhodobacter lobularis]KMW57148.1 putative peptidoglycan-binding domain-containing protein [Candidatus Rhodobacter lobularis]